MISLALRLHGYDIYFRLSNFPGSTQRLRCALGNHFPKRLSKKSLTPYIVKRYTAIL